MESDSRKRRRSDRHKRDETDKKRASRSERHQHKISILHKTYEKLVNHSHVQDDNKVYKTRMERHEAEKSNEIEEEQHLTDADQTRKYIPARKLTEQETAEMARVKQASEDEIDESSEKNAQQAEYADMDQSSEDDTEPPKKKRFDFKLRHYIMSAGAVFVLALIAYTTILYGGKLFVDPNKLMISPPTTVETEDGEIIWYLYDEYRLPVDLEQMPEHVRNAFIATEDKRFYSHGGVDMRSVFRAIYRDIVARGKVEGASTITQQLAKNLFLSSEKSWMRKTKEAMIALYLEREFTKDEILEMYLNIIYFGEGQYGVEAASNKFFYKSVEDLSLEEGALLAGIIKAPNGYSPIEHPEKAKERRNLVLRRMAEQEFISEEVMSETQSKDISLNISQRKYNPAYHTIVDIAIQEAEELYGITIDDLRENRYRLVTSLDETIQQVAYEQFQYDAYFPGNNMEKVEGSFVMMKEGTGEIVAAVGGRKFQFQDFNRVMRPVGPPGSTMKPIGVYAPALETGNYDPFSVIPDILQDWDDKPVRNSNNQYDGSVSLYNAVKYSKNTSAVWLLDDIGVKQGRKYLEKMHFNVKDESARRIALGDLQENISPYDMMRSYRTFIHNGEMIEPYVIKEVYNQNGDITASADPETTKVFSSQVAWNMTEMLRSVVTEGTATAGHYPYELAGKTGTTSHPSGDGKIQDAWFVGYTPEYVSALWMGYDEVTDENYLTTGSSMPTELTKKILTEVANQKTIKETFSKPEDVIALADPITLPNIDTLSSSFVFGGFKILKAKLEWESAKDARIIYRIYEVGKNGKQDKQIGEVTDGASSFEIDQFLLFKTKQYYVVPYDPLTEIIGEPSNTVEVSF